MNERFSQPQLNVFLLMGAVILAFVGISVLASFVRTFSKRDPDSFASCKRDTWWMTALAVLFVGGLSLALCYGSFRIAAYAWNDYQKQKFDRQLKAFEEDAKTQMRDNLRQALSATPFPARELTELERLQQTLQQQEMRRSTPKPQ